MFWLRVTKRKTRDWIKWNKYSHEVLKPRALRQWCRQRRIPFKGQTELCFLIRSMNKP